MALKGHGAIFGHNISSTRWVPSIIAPLYQQVLENKRLQIKD